MSKFFSFAAYLILAIAVCGYSQIEKPEAEVYDTINGSNTEVNEASTAEHNENARFYGLTELEEKFLTVMFSSWCDNYKVYDASELNGEILENRNGTLIIERCVGYVTNEYTGDGILLNAADDAYKYISYKSSKLDIANGTIIVSYMIYNPDTNDVDDITDRYDFVLSRNWE